MPKAQIKNELGEAGWRDTLKRTGVKFTREARSSR